MRRIATALLALVALVLAGAWLGPGVAQSDQSLLANLISRALSTPSTRISIGAIEGALTSNAVIRDVRVADREGVWLTLGRARIVWSRSALLSRRLQVDALEVDRLEVSRRPVPAEEPVPSGEPLLPELPLKIVVGSFRLSELVLGEPVVGTAARLTARGSAELGAPAEGLRLAFEGRRLDSPGEVRIDLRYVPETTRLDLDLALNEPAGGIAARLLELPDLPPVALSVRGSGPLDSFASELRLEAGPTIGAEGRATMSRTDAGRRLDLDLAARVAGLLPSPIAPAFAGTTRLTGNVLIGTDGGFALQGVRLGSETAVLELTGTVDADRVLDLGLRGRALPAAGGVTRAGGAEIGRLELDARLVGPFASPRLDGSLEANQLRLAQGGLERLRARVEARPAGDSRFRFGVTAQASGIRLADPALDRAIGGRASVEAHGLVQDSVATVDDARLATGTASGTFSGQVGRTLLDGLLRADVPSLEPFSGLAGHRLRGAANLEARLAGRPADATARVDARVRGLGTGLPGLDRILGREVTARGAVLRVPGGFGFDTFRIDGAHLQARIDGRATDGAADLALVVDLPDLRPVHQDIAAGRGRVEARMTGSLERPDVRGKAEISDARAMGRPVPRLLLDFDVADLTGAFDGRVALEGQVGASAARGSGRLQRTPADGWRLEGLDAAIGSVRLAGDVALRADRLAEGRIAFAAGDLDDLSPLVLTRLGGSAEATIALAVRDGGQHATISAKGARLAVAGQSVRDFRMEVTVADIYRAPMIDGSVEARELVLGGETFTSVRLDSRGTPRRSDFTLSARARGFAVDGAGRVVPADAIRIELDSFTARRGDRRIALAEPATLAIRNGRVAIPGLAIAVDRGRITLAGEAGERLDLRVDARDVPLAAAGIAMPGLALSGTLDGRAELEGPAAAPTGTYRVDVTSLVLPATRQAGVPPLSVRAEGRFAAGRATVDASVSAPRGEPLRVTGSVPLGEGQLDLSVTGRIDLAFAAGLLPAGQRVTGQAIVDLAVRGTAEAPALEGTASVRGATFADAGTGVRFDGIEARLRARGTELSIESANARTPNGGSVTAIGRIALDPAAGFPADLSLRGQRVQLASGRIVTAVADLDLAIDGPLATSPRVAGEVGIASMDVTIPDRLPTTLRPLPGTRHVAPPPTARARLALARQRAASSRAPFTARLDLRVAALNRIFVRGRGLHAELGGDLRLQGTSRDPVAIGAFDLRRGRFDLLGQRIDLVRGRVDFTGDLTPSLDFAAETRAADVTARIVVTGPADRPEFTLTSTPDLPQDEIVSRILFGRAAGGLSAGQALQLAQAVATLSGGEGTGVFEQVRRALGVDSLDITTGAGGGPAVGLSRYVTDNVRIGVRAGGRPEETGVRVDIDITRRLKAQGEVGVDGRSSVGVGVEWEY